MGRLANMRLGTAWSHFVDAVSESQAVRKDEESAAHLHELRTTMAEQAAAAEESKESQLRGLLREIEEQAAHHESTKQALQTKFAERCLRHWHYRLLSDCFSSWSAWVDQRVTNDMAVEQALDRLWQSRVSIVFAEWCAWVELRSAWAVMLHQGLDIMNRVRLEHFFGSWAEHAGEMTGLDSVFRRTVQRLSYGCVSRSFEGWLLVTRFEQRSRGVIDRLVKGRMSRKLRRIVNAWQDTASEKVVWKLASVHVSNRLHHLRKENVFSVWYGHCAHHLKTVAVLHRAVHRMQMGAVAAAFQTWTELCPG